MTAGAWGAGQARARVTPTLGGLLGVLVAGLLLTGCGSSSLSDQALRQRATRICNLARVETDRIAEPTRPTEGERFIRQGIAALAPELPRLRRLRPPGDMKSDYADALAAFSKELATLRSTLTGLHAGNDPVVAIKTLQESLTAPEAQATGAWQALNVPACSALTA